MTYCTDNFFLILQHLFIKFRGWRVPSSFLG